MEEIDTEEKILTSSNSQNQSFSPQWNQRSSHDQNLQSGTFSEAKVYCLGRSNAKAPFTTLNHKWPSSKALQSKPALPALLQDNLSSPNSSKFMEPQTRETDMSSASSLFVGQHCHKTLCYLKSYDQNIVLAKIFFQFLSKNKRHDFHFHQELHWTVYSPFFPTAFCHFKLTL